MPDRKSYYADMNRKRMEKLRSISEELPVACEDFFRSIEPTTSVLTRLNYAHDLRLFFTYLNENAGERFCGPIRAYTDQTLSSLTVLDIERYLEHLNYFKDEAGRVHENGNAGKARKVSSLKSFYKYLYRTSRVPENVLGKIEMPKIREKEIIRLEADEVANLLDAVDSGEKLTKTQELYHSKTKKRDIAILTLLLGTGIRISELVGLDRNNVDFSTNSFLVTRKGGARVVLYFGEEVKKALAEYLSEREHMNAQSGHEQALFLSLQMRRITQRAIQKLVDKYASIVTPLKHISPHKFRSTFGTMLNAQTGDIYLVADVLGNKDVNTTRRHYAAIDDQRRRDAARIIKLRDE